MWSIEARDILILQGAGGGEPFTKFVDALIRAHCFAFGIPDAELRTNCRANVSDGGVDTQVNRAVPNDSSGCFTFPTCWQYKSKRFSDIGESDLLAEVNKPYSLRLIAEGYAYRLAICDDMPPQRQEKWSKLLSDEAHKINPKAPAALVVTASVLSRWANAYPALLPMHFRLNVGPVLHFEAWAQNASYVIPKYVPDPRLRGATEKILAHTDLAQAVARPTITVQGLAGVGKTRLVYEALASLQGARNLVCYADSGAHAEDAARFLANNGTTRGILVADECPLDSRLKIADLLRGHTSRARVVCIDNSADRLRGSTEEELRLEQIPQGILDEVLRLNFPGVPEVNRRVYARLSGGYVRLAADLCGQDAKIQRAGNIGPGLRTVGEYFDTRLEDDGVRKVVEAIALCQKVGYREGVDHELEALCDFVGLTRQQVLDAVRTVKDAPGFVAQTTRLLYITPEIVASVAFERAWRRWFEADPQDALTRFPAALRPPLQLRIAQKRVRGGTSSNERLFSRVNCQAGTG